jgi:hypothetical protein
MLLAADCRSSSRPGPPAVNHSSIVPYYVSGMDETRMLALRALRELLDNDDPGDWDDLVACYRALRKAIAKNKPIKRKAIGTSDSATPRNPPRCRTATRAVRPEAPTCFACWRSYSRGKKIAEVQRTCGSVLKLARDDSAPDRGAKNESGTRRYFCRAGSRRQRGRSARMLTGMQSRTSPSHPTDRHGK